MPDIKFIWFGYLNKFLTTSYILKCIKHKPDNVILPGYIKGNVIKGALYYANCMFFPTNEETEGIVALEALATKLTLVTRQKTAGSTVAACTKDIVTPALKGKIMRNS